MSTMTREEDIKTSLRIPREIMRELKHIAADSDTNVTSLVIEALQDFINSKRKRK